MVAISLVMSQALSPEIDDKELVRRFVAGDENSFAEIVRRHETYIFTVVIGLIKCRHDAEELVQDTFIRAHRCFLNFRGDSSVKTWLTIIATNLARNRYWYFRRRKRHMTLSTDAVTTEDGDQTFGELIACEQRGPRSAVVTEEFETLIFSMLERLSDSHRDILIRRAIRRQSYGAIAADLEINEGTVKSRIARARMMLMRALQAANPDLGSHPQAADFLESLRAEETAVRRA